MQGNYSSVFGVDFDIHLNNYHDLMWKKQMHWIGQYNTISICYVVRTQIKHLHLH